jgi:hypothetical protein
MYARWSGVSLSAAELATATGTVSVFGFWPEALCTMCKALLTCAHTHTHTHTHTHNTVTLLCRASQDKHAASQQGGLKDETSITDVAICYTSV